MSDQEVIDLVADPDAHTLAPVDRAMISLASKIVRGAADVSEREIVSLRDCGLSDEEIFDVVLAAAARCFFSKALDATGTTPDAALAQLAPALREALTVGRPIDLAADPDNVPVSDRPEGGKQPGASPDARAAERQPVPRVQ